MEELTQEQKEAIKKEIKSLVGEGSNIELDTPGETFDESSFCDETILERLSAVLPMFKEDSVTPIHGGLERYLSRERSYAEDEARDDAESSLTGEEEEGEDITGSATVTIDNLALNKLYTSEDAVTSYILSICAIDGYEEEIDYTFEVEDGGIYSGDIDSFYMSGETPWISVYC